MSDILEKANIPKDAKIAFEGMRCRVYQWPQTLYDGSVEIFEKTRRIPASTVIAIVEGQIQILEEQLPHLTFSYISLPGGHADFWDEPLSEIAKRELREETGLESSDWQLFADLTQVTFNIFEHHVYLARGCSQVAEPILDKG